MQTKLKRKLAAKSFDTIRDLFKFVSETKPDGMRKTYLAIFYATALTVVITVVTTLSCSRARSEASCIMPKNIQLAAGDIVLRKGTGLTSHAVTMADGSSDYSHCGIVVDCGNKMMIVHAVPDEPDFEGDKDRVKLERPEKFYSSIRASKGCVLRCKNRDTAVKSSRLALAIYRRGMLFDNDYDDSDTTSMYCSELVEHVYSRSGTDLTGGIRHDVRLPGVSFNHVIYPSDFINSKQLEKVAEFKQ